MIYIHINNNQKEKSTMDTSFIHFKINAELKKELQIQAVKENKTLTDLLTDLIKDYLNEKK